MAEFKFLADITGPQGDRGVQGLPGTFTGATVEMIPYGDAASVVITGEGSTRYAHFKIPEGKPGTNAIPTEEALAQFLAAKDSLPREVIDLLFPSKGSGAQALPDMRALSYQDQVITTTAGTGWGYPCVLKNDGFIPGGASYYGFFSQDHGTGPSTGVYMVAFDQHGDPWENEIRIVTAGTQLETPWVVFDRIRGRILLYASGPGIDGSQVAFQATGVWETTPSRFFNDPQDWDYVGISHDLQNLNAGYMQPTGSQGHAGYQKPAIIGGSYVSVGLAHGGGSGNSDLYVSTDGDRYFRYYAPVDAMPDVNNSSLARLRIDHFFEWGGDVWAAGRLRYPTSGAGQVSGTQLVVGRVRDDLTGFAGTPQTLFTPPTSGDGHNGDIRGFCLLVEDSQFHLYYGSTIESINYAKAVY